MLNKRSSRIDLILRSAQEVEPPLYVSGLPPSPRALLITKYIASANKQHPLIVICADDSRASDLASDFEALSSLMLPQTEPLSVVHFPAWEQSLYSSISPSLRVRLARISALSSIASSHARVLVTTLPAACQATLPRKFFVEQQVRIAINDSTGSRESLISKLLDNGYLRVETVEDPGTFAVRGEIVDIFPPNKDQPIRLELFGELVERIREFDPGNQRTTTNPAVITEIIIPPAREVLIQRQTVSSIKVKLKHSADEFEISRTIRDPILASIQDGIYFDHSEAWAPFAYSELATMWDYLSPNYKVIWDDKMACEQAWEQFYKEQLRLFSLTREPGSKVGLIAPHPEQLFPRTEVINEVIRQQTFFELDSLEISTPEVVSQPENNPGISNRHWVFIKTPHEVVPGSRHQMDAIEGKLRQWKEQGFQIFVFASTKSQSERIRFLLEERGLICSQDVPQNIPGIFLRIGSICAGFEWPTEGLVVLTENEILGTKHVKKQRHSAVAESGSAAKDWSGLSALSDLSVGDPVVHLEHGIGRYLGLSRLDFSGAPSDFLLLEYANKDKLYIPVYRLNVIQKYVGGGESTALDKLGSQQFQKTKDKVREAVKKLAIDLVQLYAQRKIRPGFRFSLKDSAFREFESNFPFEETPDQLKAIEDVLNDMEQGRAMDRLVCGDVGYGKTEVAIRAAFRAVSDGKQVAILVPTTVLAYQHELSFKARFKDYPIIIDSVSRFKSAAEQKMVIEALAEGKTDIVIGTHRLLSRDVKFKDLGLIVVDEEHRFGVEHKEKLKTLKINTDVLTLTATPIPRTLHMALGGLRDISLINTPPVDRLPIRTYVSKYDEELIRRTIEFELSRGGQVFFLYNRVESIQKMAAKLRELMKNGVYSHCGVGIAHGQMGEGELEKAMLAFYEKQTQVLVCTTIIESGLDIPSANTLIVYRADTLGLAQLYQIRGRVGRGQNRAFAYLMIPEHGAVTETARQRLEVIQKFVELGSGFSVASHDLEIRGGGDLLGAQQSGNIAAVGFDLYMELLEEAIHELEGKPADETTTREPEIKVPFPAFLSEEYVPDVHQRLSLYRRFSGATQESEIDRFEEELMDRFGPLPIEAQNLLWLIRIKLALKSVGVSTLTVGSEKLVLVPDHINKIDPIKAISMVAANHKKYQLLPDSRFVINEATKSLRDLYFALNGIFKKISL